MNEPEPNVGPTKPAVPLEYGRGNASGDWWRKTRGEINEHVDGVFSFIGMLIGIICSARQLIWAVGLALCAAGLGRSLQHYPSRGPVFLFVGALLIGMIVPAPKRRK